MSLKHRASGEQIRQSSVNGIIRCLDELIRNGTPKKDLKDSAKKALTAGIALDKAQIRVIMKILNEDDLAEISKEIMGKIKA